MATEELRALNSGGYEAPKLTVLGSVSELTFDINKQWGESDGFMVLGVPITNASA